MNSTVLSHKMKEDKEASNLKLSKDCDIHHGEFVVAFASAFSSSSFFFMGMVT